jgi:hypothetical protein
MYTYRCPGCGKHHSVDSSFEKQYQSKCLRCGASITVTAELIHQAEKQVRATTPNSILQQAIHKAPASKVTATVDKDQAAEADTFSLREGEKALDDAPEPEAQKRRKASRVERDDAVPRKKKTARRAAQRADELEEDNDDIDISDLDSGSETEQPTPPWKKPVISAKPRRPRWQLIAAISTVVLVVAGVGGYLAFGGKKTPPKPALVAKKSSEKPKPKGPPTTKKTEEEKTPAPSAPQGPPQVDVALSAPKLSTELKANPSETNSKYEGKILEVTGLYDKTDRREGHRPPARPHALFLTEGTPICCDLEGSHAEKSNWNSLTPRQPFTVRGRYVKDGFLKDCWLVPVTPTADHKFKGKVVEVVSVVEEVPPINERQPFPTLRLEGETNSTLPLVCYFPKSAAAEVKKIQPGTHLIIKGLCNGRQTTEDLLTSLRIDNCEVVYSSAPSPGMLRLNAGQLLHEFEEDTRSEYVPPPGAEPRIDKPLRAKQIAKEFADRGAAFADSYRNHLVILTGKLQPGPRKQTLMLESGDTDQALRIECYFSKTALPALDKRPDWRIRGRCAGMSKPKTLRLDNCEIDEPLTKEPRLVADFLPHTPGRTFTFDVAVLGGSSGKKKGESVQREIHLQGPDGLTETTVTHAGTMTGDSIFAEGEQEKWIAQPKTKKIRGAVSGIVPVYYRRLSAGFIEVGVPALDANKKMTISWTPALKIGAKAGVTWTWTPPSGLHEFTVV